MNSRILFCICSATTLLLAPGFARADVRSKAVQEAVEYAAKKLGWKVGREGMEAVAKKLEAQAARHGDDVLAAFRKVGPKSLEIAEQHGAKGLRLVAQHGEGAIAHVLARPKALALVGKFGGETAEALIKHPGIAEEAIEKLGAPAVRAFSNLGPRSGRRLAMMAGEGGELAKIGRVDELLGVIGKFGDKGMNFIWDNKFALLTTIVLAEFLSNPEPFINGTRELVTSATKEVVAPVVGAAVNEVVREVGEGVTPEVARGGNWTPILLTIVAIVVLTVAVWVVRPALLLWRGIAACVRLLKGRWCLGTL